MTEIIQAKKLMASRGDSRRLTPQLRSESENLKAVKAASRVAETILTSYPDYGKTHRNYTDEIVALIAGYPPEIQARIADLKTGIRSKCDFLPTIAKITEFVEEITRPNFPGIGLRDYRNSDGTRRAVDTEPYRPEIVPYISNRETRNPEHYAAARKSEAETLAGIRRAERMLSYVKELGNGSALDGWLIAIERGEGEPPADWEPKP
jgi:hypothetical protein